MFATNILTISESHIKKNKNYIQACALILKSMDRTHQKIRDKQAERDANLIKTMYRLETTKTFDF